MQERYNPKGPLRSLSERPSADMNNAANDDPLAELARIVQGRPASASAENRGRDAQPRANGKSDPLSDLEAELMSDLQASFAAIRDAVPPPESEPEPQPETPTPAMKREPPPDFPSLSDAFAQFQAQAEAQAAAEAEAEGEYEPEPEPEQPPPPRLVPIPEAPAMQPVVHHRPPQSDQTPPDRVARIVRPAPEPPPEPLQEQPRADIGSAFQLRPTAVTPNPAPPPRQPHSRWEQPEEPAEPATSAGPSRFAPPRSAPAAEPEPAYEEPEQEDDPFADSLFTSAVEEEGEGAFPFDSFGADRDEEPAGLEDEDYAAYDRPRRGRTMWIVGSMLAVVIVAGGIGYAVFGSGGTSSTTTPPTITADAGPTKITPDNSTPSSDSDAQNKLIYDRINSSDSTSSDTTLVKPNDGTIADVPTNGNSDNAISRVILPGGPVDGASSGDAAAADTSGGTQDESLGPRKVRTVIVKPDGTIVSSSATDAPATGGSTAANATPPKAVTTTTTTGGNAASDTSAAPAVAPTVPPPAKTVTDDTQAVSGGATGPGKELVITPNPDVANTTVATAPPAKATPPKAVTTTTTSNSAPVKLTNTPPAKTTASGFMVQVSSQRSEETARATFKDLQTRYPGILGSYQVDIQRAEIANRGVFYRARVGPFPASDAQRLCDDLKSAGGDCLLTRR